MLDASSTDSTTTDPVDTDDKGQDVFCRNVYKACCTYYAMHRGIESDERMRRVMADRLEELADAVRSGRLDL